MQQTNIWVSNLLRKAESVMPCSAKNVKKK